MSLVYCDHNFVVTAHQGPEQYKNHLRQLATGETVIFVLSPMHWVEMAEDEDDARGIAKADFVDSLSPRWLYDRRTVQRKEIADAFFRFARIPSAPPQFVTDVRDVIANLAGQAGDRDSRSFGTHLRGVGPNHPLEQGLRSAFAANQTNGARFRAGRLNPVVLQNVERLYIQHLLPTDTPAGIAIDVDSKNRFLDAYRVTDFPSFALETRATHDNWREARQLNRNTFMDQQHVMALPYVDFFITDDRRLAALITRIVAGAPFRTATILTKADFDLRYPQ